MHITLYNGMYHGALSTPYFMMTIGFYCKVKFHPYDFTRKTCLNAIEWNEIIEWQKINVLCI